MTRLASASYSVVPRLQFYPGSRKCIRFIPFDRVKHSAEQSNIIMAEITHLSANDQAYVFLWRYRDVNQKAVYALQKEFYTFTKGKSSRD